ncbi:hypothetical protein J6590_082083 [Homalodisca vitripennis]|nr:hypothetical protein J6590_082083 [Homalodisca vitripennis]
MEAVRVRLCRYGSPEECLSLLAHAERRPVESPTFNAPRSLGMDKRRKFLSAAHDSTPVLSFCPLQIISCYCDFLPNGFRADSFDGPARAFDSTALGPHLILTRVADVTFPQDRTRSPRRHPWSTDPTFQDGTVGSRLFLTRVADVTFLQERIRHLVNSPSKDILESDSGASVRPLKSRCCRTEHILLIFLICLREPPTFSSLVFLAFDFSFLNPSSVFFNNKQYPFRDPGHTLLRNPPPTGCKMRESSCELKQHYLANIRGGGGGGSTETKRLPHSTATVGEIKGGRRATRKCSRKLFQPFSVNLRNDRFRLPR